MTPEDSNYELYYKERKMLLDAEVESSRWVDSIILILSTVAFAWLTSLHPDVLGANIPGIIFLSQLTFGLSILAVLLSCRVSQLACRKQLELNNIAFQDRVITRESPLSPAVDSLNTIAMVLFISGAVLVLVMMAFH